MKNRHFLLLMCLILMVQGCTPTPKTDDTDNKNKAGKDYPFPDNSSQNGS